MNYTFLRFCPASRMAFGALICSLVAITAPGAENPGGGRHCLWKVTSARAPFYLLGSIHALRATDYPLAPPIMDAIQQAQQFYFEYDPKLDNALAKKLVAAAKLPPNTDIKNLIRPETYS